MARFDDASFDAVLSREADGDGEIKFAEAARVLRPGGCFVVDVRRLVAATQTPAGCGSCAATSPPSRRLRPGRERPTRVAHRHGRPALGGVGEKRIHF